MSLPEPCTFRGPKELAAAIEDGEQLVRQNGILERERNDVFLLALAGCRCDVAEARRILHNPDAPCSFHIRMGRELNTSALTAHRLLDWQHDSVPIERIVENLRQGNA